MSEQLPAPSPPDTVVSSITDVSTKVDTDPTTTTTTTTTTTVVVTQAVESKPVMTNFDHVLHAIKLWQPLVERWNDRYDTTTLGAYREVSNWQHRQLMVDINTMITEDGHIALSVGHPYCLYHLSKFVHRKPYHEAVQEDSYSVSTQRKSLERQLHRWFGFLEADLKNSGAVIMDGAIPLSERIADIFDQYISLAWKDKVFYASPAPNIVWECVSDDHLLIYTDGVDSPSLREKGSVADFLEKGTDHHIQVRNLLYCLTDLPTSSFFLLLKSDNTALDFTADPEGTLLDRDELAAIWAHGMICDGTCRSSYIQWVLATQQESPKAKLVVAQ